MAVVLVRDRGFEIRIERVEKNKDYTMMLSTNL
jgi:hypothetical protein